MAFYLATTRRAPPLLAPRDDKAAADSAGAGAGGGGAAAVHPAWALVEASQDSARCVDPLSLLEACIFDPRVDPIVVEVNRRRDVLGMDPGHFLDSADARGVCNSVSAPYVMGP